MFITNSYKTAFEKNKDLAKNHDEEVIRWKKSIEEGITPDIEFSVSKFF